MYTTTRRVPRITQTTIAAVEQVAPGLTAISEIPLLPNVATAEIFILNRLNRTLDRYETVGEVLSVVEVEDGAAWEFTFRIIGD